MKIIGLGLVGILISLSSYLQAEESVRYTVTDLGGYRIQISRMNAAGDVVGAREAKDGHNFHAFLYTKGEMHDLGFPGESASAAMGINDAGEVVGFSDSHGFRYAGGRMTDLQTLNGQPGFDRATDIDRSGSIIGWPRDSSKACLYRDEHLHMLGEAGSTFTANRINAAGQIVGMDERHALLITADGKMTDLGTLGGDYSDAFDLNATGQIVGRSKIANGKNHAFLYFAGAMQDLGVPDEFEESEAKGINASGQIVGRGATTRAGDFLQLVTTARAYLYSAGKWTDLNRQVDLAGSGLKTLMFAEAINDRGQIAGVALADDGIHGFLLTPLGATGK